MVEGEFEESRPLSWSQSPLNQHHSSPVDTDPRSRNSPGYENEEADYDPEEPLEEDVVNYVDDVAAGENPDGLLTHGDRDVIISGDASAGHTRGKSGIAPKAKKIPNDQRTTTPYMTKYERARILGTRALQIRYVRLGKEDSI